jgi:hypothetical protein
MRLSDLVRKYNQEKLGGAFEEVEIGSNSKLETGVSGHQGLTSILADFRSDLSVDDMARSGAGNGLAPGDVQRIHRNANMIRLASTAALVIGSVYSLSAGDPSAGIGVLGSTVSVLGWSEFRRQRLLDQESFKQLNPFYRAFRRYMLPAFAAAFALVLAKDPLIELTSPEQFYGDVSLDVRLPENRDFDKLIDEAQRAKDELKVTALDAERKQFLEIAKKMRSKIHHFTGIVQTSTTYPAEYSLDGVVVDPELAYRQVKRGDTLELRIVPRAEKALGDPRFPKNLRLDPAFIKYLPDVGDLTTRIYFESHEAQAIEIPGDKENTVQLQVPERVAAGGLRLVIETFAKDRKYDFLAPLKREIVPLTFQEDASKAVFVPVFGADYFGTLDLVVADASSTYNWSVRSTRWKNAALLFSGKQDTLRPKDIFHDTENDHPKSDVKGYRVRFALPKQDVEYYTRVGNGEYSRVRLLGAFDDESRYIYSGGDKGRFSPIRLDVLDDRNNLLSRAQRLVRLSHSLDDKRTFETVIFRDQDSLYKAGRGISLESGVYVDLQPGREHLVSFGTQDYRISWDSKGGFTVGDDKLGIDLNKNRMKTAVKIGRDSYKVECRYMNDSSDADKGSSAPTVTLRFKRR